jgi:hypothetical protein
MKNPIQSMKENWRPMLVVALVLLAIPLAFSISDYYAVTVQMNYPVIIGSNSTSGGNVMPAGPPNAIQFNLNGALAGSSLFEYNQIELYPGQPGPTLKLGYLYFLSNQTGGSGFTYYTGPVGWSIATTNTLVLYSGIGAAANEGGTTFLNEGHTPTLIRTTSQPIDVQFGSEFDLNDSSNDQYLNANGVTGCITMGDVSNYYGAPNMSFCLFNNTVLINNLGSNQLYINNLPAQTDNVMGFCPGKAPTLANEVTMQFEDGWLVNHPC